MSKPTDGDLVPTICPSGLVGRGQEIDFRRRESGRGIAGSAITRVAFSCRPPVNNRGSGSSEQLRQEVCRLPPFVSVKRGLVRRGGRGRKNNEGAQTGRTAQPRRDCGADGQKDGRNTPAPASTQELFSRVKSAGR